MMNQSITVSSRQLELVVNLLANAAVDDNLHPVDQTAAAALATSIARLEVDKGFTGRGQSIKLVVQHWSIGE